jgi:hypothetical protein
LTECESDYSECPLVVSFASDALHCMERHVDGCSCSCTAHVQCTDHPQTPPVHELLRWGAGQEADCDSELPDGPQRPIVLSYWVVGEARCGVVGPIRGGTWLYMATGLVGSRAAALGHLCRRHIHVLHIVRAAIAAQLTAQHAAQLSWYGTGGGSLGVPDGTLGRASRRCLPLLVLCCYPGAGL